MAIRNYSGQTFVAFLDISGFKELMKQNNRALKALNRLYQIGYDTIKAGSPIEGIFISDCGVLFVRDTDNKYQDLCNLLNGIKEINRRMLIDDFLTVTSIAYGQFKYQDKLEIEGIEKNAVYGGAYVEAFFDNEKGEPKIKVGQVRVINKNIPPEVIEAVEGQGDQTARLLKRKGKHFYYYWSIENPEESEELDRKYKDSYNLVFSGIVKALKGE